MKKAFFIIPIYTVQIDVIVSRKLEKYAVMAGYKGDCAGYDGLTLSYPSNPSIYCMIFRSKTVDEGVIAHEVGHLVSKIFKACDIKYDPENMEPWCYLQGYITKALHKIVWPGDTEKRDN